MRTGLLALVAWLSCGHLCPAQEWDWATAMFDHTSHDFGVVARGAKVEHRFTLDNIYLEDMRIESITSSCSCTKPTYSREPIKTYDKSEIVATIDTRKFLGRKEATLRVKLAEPFAAEVQLHVYCYIRSDVVVEPGAVQFGSIEQGSGARRKVTVSYAGRPDWQILYVETTWPYLAASVSEVSRMGGQTVYDLWVTLQANAPVGYIKDHLTLITNDRNSDATRVPIAVEGVVVSAVSVAPSPLSLGVLQTGQTVTRNLVVRGKAPFRVLECAGPDGRFQFAVPQAAAPVQLVPVTFSAGEQAGKVDGTIRIQTDIEGTPPLEVKVDAMVLPEEK